MSEYPSLLPLKVMVFIDGGYIRKWIVDICKKPIERFSFAYLADYITQAFLDEIGDYRIIRTYFYDGLADSVDPEHLPQKEFHSDLNFQKNFEVRTGRLVRDGERRFRQKGVDVLMAIDMLEKANSNQYDIAVIIAGDLDHLEAVKTVKSKGKQVFGAYYAGSESMELIENLDNEFELKKDIVEEFILKN